MSSKPGEAVIAGDGPYVLLANNPEMYLLHKGDGTVWCKWRDGSFIEVVPKSQLDQWQEWHRSGRANIEGTERGIRVCQGHHDTNAECQWEYYEPADEARDEAQDVRERWIPKYDDMVAALEQIESCPDDSTVLRDIARNALRRKV